MNQIIIITYNSDFADYIYFYPQFFFKFSFYCILQFFTFFNTPTCCFYNCCLSEIIISFSSYKIKISILIIHYCSGNISVMINIFHLPLVILQLYIKLRGMNCNILIYILFQFHQVFFLIFSTSKSNYFFIFVSF